MEDRQGQPLEHLAVKRFYFLRKGRKYAIGQYVDRRGHICDKKGSYGLVDEVTKTHAIVLPLLRGRISAAGKIGNRNFD